MNIQHLDHVAIVCSDSEASRAWYMDVFEMEWIHKGLWNDNPFFLQKGSACVALFQAGSTITRDAPAGPRLDHFAWRAETWEDYEFAKRELSKKGIPFDEQDHDISYSIYMSDPDGNKVEITTYDIGKTRDNA